MKRNPACWHLVVALNASFLLLLSARSAPVHVSEVDLEIPTYLAGPPDPNPMFDLGRSSQGAQGRVYPYPLYDTLTNVKTNKSYRIVYLENEYVRIGVLPEIGGRLFEAIDKSNGYNFIYRQHVIKPALIGLIGAWISGGIEWNIPHHHRATTFLPVQYRIEAGPDGSKTVWVGELEIRHRMRWAVGYTLHPEKSYLECSVRILNRTPVANTMLCFANVAVHVNENYQVIYPPSTRFVTFHGKREFTTWPIATTRYAGADFTKGVDVSWYSNHLSANSMFAWNYQDDFFAGYDHGREAGILSFANHHIVPGKKFWTWGTGPRGRMWDKILTDDDGPYIELMVGAYSDNQPDYSWLQPYETRSFEMYWYPFRDIGGVTRATLDAAVNLQVLSNNTARVGFCVTAEHRAVTATLMLHDRALFTDEIAISPSKPFIRELPLPPGADPHALRAALTEKGRDLVAYSPPELGPVSLPAPVKSPPPPNEVKTIEELYLDGQRLEQFHSPEGRPEPYWEEALHRDPDDARVNVALGIREWKAARFAESEQRFRQAINRLTTNYTSPKDSEPFYYLGLALKAQDKLEAAFDAFYKATWSREWCSPAYLALAEIATRRGAWADALNYVDRSLEANALNVRALGLKCAILRQLKQKKAARSLLDLAAAHTDPLDVRLMAERCLLGDSRALNELRETTRQHPATALETAAEYADAGLWADGTNFLWQAVASRSDNPQVSPLVYYYLARFSERLGNSEAAVKFRSKAAVLSPDYVFPFQWEAIDALRSAIRSNPTDARAPYYLGNFLFDGQPEEAVLLWKKAAELDPGFAIVHRNLGVAYAHQRPGPDIPSAIHELELAVSATVKYADHFTELDELYAQTGVSPAIRLTLLEKNHEIVARRDDALSREIGLKIFAAKYDEAIALMSGRKFSVWEGGSLDVVDHWVNAHLGRGRQKLGSKQPATALADFEAARTVPPNLPTEHEVGREAEIAYWIGLAADATGDSTRARDSWTEATRTEETTGRAKKSVGHISPQKVQTCFVALAQAKLGRSSEAEVTLKGLLEQAEPSLKVPSENRSTSGKPDRAQALADYVAGLSHLGLGQKEEARSRFEMSLKMSPDFWPAKNELNNLHQP